MSCVARLLSLSTFILTLGILGTSSTFAGNQDWKNFPGATKEQFNQAERDRAQRFHPIYRSTSTEIQDGSELAEELRGQVENILIDPQFVAEVEANALNTLGEYLPQVIESLEGLLDQPVKSIHLMPATENHSALRIFKVGTYIDRYGVWIRISSLADFDQVAAAVAKLKVEKKTHRDLFETPLLTPGGVGSTLPGR